MNISVVLDYDGFCMEHFYSSGEFKEAFERFVCENHEFLRDTYDQYKAELADPE